jgi:hypothetical protein
MKLFFAFLCASVIANHSAAAPHVLLIVCENNGPEFGCYGNPYARTPNVDKLTSA